MADWSHLPKELLELIADRLDTCFDLVHFRSVCSSWRSLVSARSRVLCVRCPLARYPYITRIQDNCYLEKLPVFLLRFPQSQTQASTTRCCLVKVREDEHGRMKLQSPLYAQGQFYGEGLRVLGPDCSILLDSLSCQITPLCHEYIIRLTRWHDSLRWGKSIEGQGKAAFMQLGTTGGDFAVLGAFFPKNLAMFTSTDMKWRELTSKTGRNCADIASFNGKFYIVDDTERTIVVEPSSDETFFWNAGTRARRKKLVRSGDELLLVEIFSLPKHFTEGKYLDPRERMIRCRVFKLDEHLQKWDRVEHLGDRVLFLGEHCKFSCSSSDLPRVKGNCLFFCDPDYGASWEHILVFDLGDGVVESIGNVPAYLEIFQPPPELIISSVSAENPRSF